MPLRNHQSIQTMMESTGISSAKSFLETNCSECGDDVEKLRNSQKNTCKVCNKIFHYPTCWNKHKEATGHNNL